MIDGNFGQVVESFSGAGRASSRASIPGASAAELSANRFNVWSYDGGLRLVFEDPNRNGQFRLYSPPAYAYALRSSRGADRMDFVRIAQEEVRETPERFTFTPPGRRVDLPLRVTAFKGDGEPADLYAHYGVPLVPDASDGAVRDVDLTIRTGAFVVGADRDLLAERRRTVYGLRGAQIVALCRDDAVDQHRAAPGAGRRQRGLGRVRDRRRPDVGRAPPRRSRCRTLRAPACSSRT